MATQLTGGIGGTMRLVLPKTISGSYSVPTTPAASASPYAISGDPYYGNIYAGIPTTLGATPYGPQLATAKQALYNNQQLRGIANQQAGAQTNAALGASNASSAAEQAAIQAQENRAGGFAAALGSFGPQYAQAMQSAYNQAANTVGQFGTGVVGQVGQDLSAAQSAAQAAASDKTGGQGQVSSYDIPGITGALTQAGVNIPGNSLAVAGLNAAQTGMSGARADQDYAMNTVSYYQQQASQALQQRAAERASIIAQRPQLFQSALEAQRQDNYQTQNRIDSLTSAATDWINQRRGTAVSVAQSQAQLTMANAAMTHINPQTGEPFGGYTWADKAHTIAVPFKDLAAYKTAAARNKLDATHYGQQNTYWQGRNKIAQERANSATGAKVGSFNRTTSALAGMAVDGNFRPILNPSTGRPIAYKAPTKAGKTLTPGQLQRATGAISSIVHDLRFGHTINATKTKTGVTYNPVSASDAVQYLQRAGYFSSPQMGRAAVQSLQQFYPPQEIEIALGTSAGPPAPLSAYPPSGAPDPYAPTVIPAGTPPK